ncbi:MAG: GNAT family N-acetyltransferase [Sporomusaceae bacterium]|nr:GNAT family N-acetyltransferase [Sporomusaceae bacterium]
MINNIIFAESGHEDILTELFTTSGMDLAGVVEDHILLQEEAELMAAAFVEEIEENLFHLAVFAVNPERRNQKIGSYLLQEILKNPRQYCRNQGGAKSTSFQLTTVAKGNAVEFYKKHGFTIGEFSQLQYPYNVQCEKCLDKEACAPVPLVFTKTAYLPQKWLS